MRDDFSLQEAISYIWFSIRMCVLFVLNIPHGNYLWNHDDIDEVFNEFRHTGWRMPKY
jgi:hypothetical protein